MTYYRFMITTGHQGWLITLCSPPWMGTWCSSYTQCCSHLCHGRAPGSARDASSLHWSGQGSSGISEILDQTQWLWRDCCGGMHHHILCFNVKFLFFTFLFFYFYLPVNYILDLTDTRDLKVIQFWKTNWNCWPKTMKRSLYVPSKRERQKCQCVLYLTPVTQHWKTSPSLGFRIKACFAYRETPWGKQIKKLYLYKYAVQLGQSIFYNQFSRPENSLFNQVTFSTWYNC